MAKLIITRPRRFANHLRRYRILVDGETAATVANGKAAEIELTPGRHLVTARFDFRSSPPAEIQAEPEGVYRFIVGSNLERRPLLRTVMFLTVLAPAPILFLTIAAGRLFRDPLEGSWFSRFVAPMVMLPFLLQFALTIINRHHFLYLEDLASPDPADRRVPLARSEPLRVWVTIRGLMIAVAILAILFGAVVEWTRFTRGEFFRRKADYHSLIESQFRRMEQDLSRIAGGFVKTSVSTVPSQQAAARAAAVADYHAAVRRKYEEAAARRAFSVEPNPREPRWP